MLIAVGETYGQMYKTKPTPNGVEQQIFLDCIIFYSTLLGLYNLYNQQS